MNGKNSHCTSFFQRHYSGTISHFLDNVFKATSDLVRMAPTQQVATEDELQAVDTDLRQQQVGQWLDVVYEQECSRFWSCGVPARSYSVQSRVGY